MALTKVTGDFIKAGSITQGHLHSSHGITTSHITEGDKLFFTNARVDSRVGSLSTSNLSEGTNLYYTDARARAAISATGSLSYNSTTGVMSFTMPAQNTSNITEGSNLYYTDARADARVALIVDSAPGTLNTLNELAAALGDDANFSTTVTNSIATKLPLAGGTLTGALQAQPWLFRSMVNQTEYHVLDNGSSNGPSWKFRYDGSTANRYVDFGYKDGNGTYTSGLKLYNNQTVSWRGTDIVNANGQWTGGIASSGYNDSNWNTAYGWGNHASAGYFTNSGSWLGDLGSNGYTRENGLTMTGGSEFVVLSKSGQGSVLVDGHYMAYESNNGFFGTFNSAYGNLTGIRASAANTLKVMQLDGGNAILLVTQDVRAPLYYDSNDTVYYVNPASRSNFGDLDLNSGAVWDATTQGTSKGSLHIDPNSGTDHAGGAITFGASDHNNGQSSDAGIYVRSDGSYGTRMYLSTTDSYAVGSKTTIRLEAAGGLYVDRGNFYAPILYDLNNTSYFLNPSASGGNALKTIGDWRQTTDAWSGEVGGKMQYHGDHWYLQATGYVHFRNVSGSNTFYVDSGGTGYIANLLTAANSLRAPIFYDSNDTNHYLDPAATSVVNTLKFSGSSNNGRFDADEWGVRFKTDAGYILFGPANTGHAHIYTDRSNFYFDKQIILNGGSTINTADIRASIFYDINNTAYYTNPNSQSSLWGVAIRGDNGATSTDNQIFFWGSGNTTTSAIGFKANGGNFTNPTGNGDGYNTYLTMDTDGRGWVFRRGTGSNNFTSAYTAGWILNNGVWQANASMRAPYFYDSDDTNYYVNPAGASVVDRLNRANHHTGHFEGSYNNIGNNSAKSNPIYTIGSSYNPNATNLGSMYGIGYAHPNLWGSGKTSDWGMYIANNGSIDATIGDGSVTAWFANQVHAAGDFRAPTFYDLDNTGYYLNPNGNSVLSTANFSTVQISAGSSYNENIRMFPGSNGYSSLILGAVAGSSGTGTGQWTLVRYPTATHSNKFTIRHNSTDHVTIATAGHVTNHVDTRSPIFYDSGNTGYYVDPASTSKFNDIWTTDGGNNGTAPRWDTSFYVAQSQHYYAHTSTQTMYIGESNTINIRSVGIASGSLRAPIFYDSNNTGYYTHPDGTSVINGLTMAGALQTAGSHTVGSGGTSNIYMGGTSGSFFRFHTHGGATYFDMNAGNINWRQGSSTRFIFYSTTANMTVYGTVTQHSDLRIKDNVVEIPNCIDKVKSIRGIYYNRTDFNTEPTKIGVVAQEVEVEMPELVHDEETSGIKSVSYTELTAVLVNAIKEQQTIIDDLKSRLETLENQ